MSAASPSKKLAKIFANHRVAFAYLFGSHASRREHPRSDRDIAVQFRSRIPKSRRFDLRLQLWNSLSDVWPGEPIDLVDLADAPLLLQFRAIQPGKLLYSQDERGRVRFEASTMSQYFDRQYYMDRGAKQAIAQIAREGLQ